MDAIRQLLVNTDRTWSDAGLIALATQAAIWSPEDVPALLDALDEGIFSYLQGGQKTSISDAVSHTMNDCRRDVVLGMFGHVIFLRALARLLDAEHDGRLVVAPVRTDVMPPIYRSNPALRDNPPPTRQALEYTLVVYRCFADAMDEVLDICQDDPGTEVPRSHRFRPAWDALETCQRRFVTHAGSRPNVVKRMRGATDGPSDALTCLQGLLAENVVPFRLVLEKIPDIHATCPGATASFWNTAIGNAAVLERMATRRHHEFEAMFGRPPSSLRDEDLGVETRPDGTVRLTLSSAAPKPGRCPAFLRFEPSEQDQKDLARYRELQVRQRVPMPGGGLPGVSTIELGAVIGALHAPSTLWSTWY